MPHNPEAFAEMVTLTIKAALTPVLERIAGLDARLTQALAIEPHVTALRERVVTVETKSLQPAAVPDVPPVDLTPLLERVAAVEARLAQALGLEPDVTALRERVITIEAKSLQPAAVPAVPPVDLTPLLERLASLDARVSSFDGWKVTIDDVKDRVLAIETQATPVASPSQAEVALIVNGALDPLQKSLGTISERIAVVETRGQIPGPAGPAGKDGANGTNGKDGADGLGFDDLALEQTDERTLTVKAFRGDRTKTVGTLSFPVSIYRGVYVDGKTYERGDCVTWAGSEWHCNDTTTSKPGDGLKAWTLKVKRGRDGKDGRDAETTPIVSVGRPS